MITFSILVLLAELCSMRKPSNISPTPSLKARLSGKSCCGCLHISSTIVSFSFSQLSLGCCTQFVLGWMWRWMWTWGWSWCDVVDLFDIAMAGNCNWEQKLWRTCRAPFSETAKFDWTLILLCTHLLAHWGTPGTLLSFVDRHCRTLSHHLLTCDNNWVTCGCQESIDFDSLLRVSCLHFSCLTIVNYWTTM